MSRRGHNTIHPRGDKESGLTFRETPNATPRTYLRWNRMHGARRDLLAAEAGSASVMEIAARWGFMEPGRFAVEYRHLFAESLSATLARSAPPRPNRLEDALCASSNLD